ncbi:lactonase family protein [Vibrio sp. Isolate31]|uniref:lactonase family protein n=1 Tax=unclassified Vibrio TaxID=2614977 RepID=UPI001EFD2381|nr:MULTISPECIES: lactonase family protein [unclassified Vibrio]MCG9551880.1 lactonase family protein [Vibrio sp. Isolate32]MCG9603022.1 lactonase family protein [Vibrio sp. Isolate31]
MNLEKDYQLVIGTYSDIDALAHQPYSPKPGEGMYCATLTKNGQLIVNSAVASLNPAVLIPGSDKKYLYAILETIRENGSIVQYEVQADGSLTEVSSFQAGGKSTCYLSFSPNNDAAIVINYWDAIIDVVDVDEQGRLGEVLQSFKQYYRPESEWRQVQDREDHWGNRQVGPHAHCAHFWHEWVFIPDLGENAVFQYRWNPETRQLMRDTWIEFEPGSGPRHMAMHPNLDICYISNELFNTVCVAKLDSSEPSEVKPRLIVTQYESTLNNHDQISYVSEIKLSPDAKFLYVSNRGDNSIAVFKVLEDGKLKRIDITSTEGKFPRHFAISPCGKAAIISNQDTGNVIVFSRDLETGLIKMTDEIIEVPAPNYIRFLEL